MNAHYKTIMGMICGLGLYFIVRIFFSISHCMSATSTGEKIFEYMGIFLLYPYLKYMDDPNVYCYLLWANENPHLYYTWWIVAVGLTYDFLYRKITNNE
jgi:hypothetical protein